MELFYTLTLAFLEITFVFVGLLILHGLRKIIGSTAFFMAIGMLFIFTQFVTATELKIVTGIDGADFYIAQTVLFLPYLAAILVIYVSEGTLATQRLIIGAMAALGFYVYLSQITVVQCSWSGFSLSQGTSSDSFEYLLKNSRRVMTASIIAQTLDLFLIPIFFQRLRNMNCRIFLCVTFSLLLTQIADSIIFNTISFWGSPQWWMQMRSSYIAKAIFSIWLSIIATIYLKKIEIEVPGEGKGALDILLAFIGNYGNFEKLKQNLREWEGRYRMLVENATDMILLMDQDGMILDANPIAAKMLDMESPEQLIGKNVGEFLSDSYGKNFTASAAISSIKTPSTPIDLVINKKNGKKIELQAAVNLITHHEENVIILVARDITEQNRLNREKEELKEELAHAQRLESIGQLAGGVAHDFNNYLHAIQGNLDILLLMHDIKDEKIIKHLEKINNITENASRLTQQLLGFARKGKYRVEKIDMKKLVSETVSLFAPSFNMENNNVKLKISEGEYFVKGDFVQLKQVLLNLLLNAKDAFEGVNNNPNIIEVELAPAVNFKSIFKSSSKDKYLDMSDYIGLLVSDNGCGMDEDLKNRIFEPFFTTKPTGKGTGMGLAMVYGTLSNHNGWITLESAPGKGSKFYIFLPKYKD
ncbi:MAG TPA: ATP-binding protein [Victivallales bacterium]|nr:ATP-binding protein [Victivallales bacterium]HPO91258.1 ATP-binding protein [Victivallales bacterium]HRR27988.1 ATP-binding protein [Victivallales bacterium]HRU01878.1 ATP-binding protein [Victivallales bacterium]